MSNVPVSLSARSTVLEQLVAILILLTWRKIIPNRICEKTH
jgi:hypothetical protein